MKRAVLCAAALVAFCGSAWAGPQLAFTFDDLPSHSALPPGTTRIDIAKATIAALRAAHVPPVYGFVNGVHLAQEPDSAPVLALWRQAGFPLGNHTWSHINLNQHTVEEYGTEVLRNEPLLGETMRGEDWHWFRYPYLAEGDTPEKRAAIRAFLAARGYRIAGVTMSFADYLFNEPYARCVAKRDAKAISTLERDYLAAAAENVGFTRSLSHTLYGRDIPYVLLMHIGALDARLLPRLIALYRAKGFAFVPLAQAESDPYYRQYADPSTPAGLTSLEAEMAERNLPLLPRVDYAPLVDGLCR